MRNLYLILVAAVAVALAASSCAAATANRVVLDMTAPLYDNRQTDCGLAQDLVAVADTATRVMHARLVQGAWAAEDSMSVRAGASARFTFWPPLSAACGATAWASDAGGVGCAVTLTATPTLIRVPPAKPTMVVVP